GREPGVANLPGEAHAPIDLHAARVDALHLWQELRRFLLLDDGAAYTAQTEIDREREAGWSGPDNEYLSIHAASCSSGLVPTNTQSRAWMSPSSTWMVLTSV